MTRVTSVASRKILQLHNITHSRMFCSWTVSFSTQRRHVIVSRCVAYAAKYRKVFSQISSFSMTYDGWIYLNRYLFDYIQQIINKNSSKSLIPGKKKTIFSADHLQRGSEYEHFKLRCKKQSGKLIREISNENECRTF